MIIKTLRKRRYEVKGVSEGRAALELIAQEGMPDLLIADTDMKKGKQEGDQYVGMNCDKLITHLREKNQTNPIIVLTRDCNFLKSQNTFGYQGKLKYLSKPFYFLDEEILSGTVAEMLS